MSEAEIVSLVRCPKCQNLLPEPAGYSVYQCGGCGAVLRAKVKQDVQVFAEKSGEEKLGVNEKLGDRGNLMSSSDHGVIESNFSNEDIGCESIATAPEENSGGEMNKHSDPQLGNRGESVAGVDPVLRTCGSKLGEKEKPTDNVGHFSRSRWRGEILGKCGNVMDGSKGGRLLDLNYQEDGSSKFISESSCSNGKQGREENDLHMPKNNGNLHKNRAELLQMMEELSDQLRRSGNLGGGMKDKFPINQNAANQSCQQGSAHDMHKAGTSAGMHNGFMPDKPAISPYHDPHYLPSYPWGDRQRYGVSNPHHFPYGHSDMPGYRNHFEMQMMRGALPTPNHYEHPIPHPLYYPGQPFADSTHLYEPNSNNGLPLHPVCGFYNCCTDHRKGAQPDFLDDARFYDGLLYPQNIPDPSGQQGYHLKTSGLSSSLIDDNVRTRLGDKDTRCHTRGYVRHQQQKGKRAKVGHHCHPIASGAPFVICQGCSKLLQLPKTTFKHNSKRQFVCCGACNTVMVCALINKKLTTTLSGESKKILKRVGPHLDDLTIEGNSSELGWAKMILGSADFCSSSQESTTIIGKPHVSTRGIDLTSNETRDSQSLPVSSPASFDGVESLENIASLSPQDSPLQDQLGHSFNGTITDRVWKGSQSTRSDHEKVMPKDMISRQNSLNDTTTPQMEEVSFNVYSKTGVTRKLEPTTARNDNEKTKGSSFANVIKKSFKGLSRSNYSTDNRDRTVIVNGCMIQERLLKKAEKVAGPVQSGNYWYDFRAGFWGVIGGPCLGIIPPCIEEFNYPMQANCSSGATGVFVNGRELQQIDLDLLASRGLPTARGRSYLIEISGKVVDKDSGAELDGLGKLAPTIEKVKHGFGMKPRTQVVH